MQKQKKNNKKKEIIQTTRFYLVLIVLSIIIMIISAFITHGNNLEVINISLGTVKEKTKKEDDANNINSIKIGADLSKVPTDKEIDKILNKAIPNICDDCDEDNSLDCLKEYKTNKILIQNEGYGNQLFIELLTGKYFESTYTVVININTREILNKEGSVDEDRCMDIVDTNYYEDEIILNEGLDPEASVYINTKPRK